MRWCVAIFAVTAGAGCFSPNFANTQCSDQGECPDGFICAPDNICRRSIDDIDGGSGIDADPNTPDGNMVDSGNCWMWDPLVFDPCVLPATSQEINIAVGDDLDLNGAGELRRAGTTIATLPTVEFNGVTVVSVTNVTIPSGSSLTLRGARPMAIAAEDAMTIDGTINANSSINLPGPGAGDADLCTPGAGNGTGGPQSGGGGGGGGFQNPGAPGGEGIDSQGGPGGPMQALPILRAGCAAGDGAPAATPGTGGHGGGAVSLTAQVAISIGGGINAGGAGGGGAKSDNGGGGGGGSGGMIVIDSPSVSLATSSILAANGGGGGEGGRNGGGMDGEDGRLGDVSALGGFSGGGNGARGGNGASRGAAPMPGDSVLDGGGGGGGGVGFIVLHFMVNPVNGGTVSPAPNVMPE